jgi:hypothetical protein
MVAVAHVAAGEELIECMSVPGAPSHSAHTHTLTADGAKDDGAHACGTGQNSGGSAVLVAEEEEGDSTDIGR